ncbi:MAG: hypothetical protein Q7S96_00100 [bacterium]|nr:hypothetical protein [bacterium]
MEDDGVAIRAGENVRLALPVSRSDDFNADSFVGVAVAVVVESIARLIG